MTAVAKITVEFEEPAEGITEKFGEDLYDAISMSLRGRYGYEVGGLHVHVQIINGERGKLAGGYQRKEVYWNSPENQ
jgi:hypothetical protein